MNRWVAAACTMALAGALSGVAITSAAASPAAARHVSASTAACTNGTLVHTDKGRICGLTATGVKEWFGVPYAAPPAGSLRWQPPQPHAPWSNVLQAIVPGSACPQTSSTSPSTNQNCLVANITVPTGAGSGPLPVLVYIHGGGFTGGATYLYPEQQLATEGKVIVVGIQYRLGVLGFLADKALGAHSGDFGLQDQQAALKWVQRNITAFGGDPGNVTIMGSSAGASSVCDQIVSPTAAGLFEKAISISGEYNSLLGAPTSLQPQDCKATLPTESQADATDATFAANVGCGHASNVAACLRAVPVRKLLATPGGTNSPIINGTTLTQQLSQSFSSGAVNHVSAILGVNRDEDLTGTATTAAAYRALVKAQYGADAPRILALYPVARFGSPFVASRTVAADSNTVCPALVRDQRLAQWIPVYAYEGDDSDMPLNSSGNPAVPNGAYHDYEPGMLFPTAMGINPNFDADQQVLASQITAEFSAFARTGSPTTADTPAWPRFTGGSQLVMSMQPAGDSAMVPASTISLEHNCGFWDSITPAP